MIALLHRVEEEEAHQLITTIGAHRAVQAAALVVELQAQEAITTIGAQQLAVRVQVALVVGLQVQELIQNHCALGRELLANLVLRPMTTGARLVVVILGLLSRAPLQLMTGVRVQSAVEVAVLHLQLVVIRRQLPTIGV